MLVLVSIFSKEHYNQAFLTL